MANVFTSNPIYLDTDTTTGAGTNWRGANGGTLLSANVKGIIPGLIIFQAAAPGTSLPAVGTVTITDPQSSVVLLTLTVDSTTELPITIDMARGGSLWRDFIVTGLTATNMSLQIFYRGW